MFSFHQGNAFADDLHTNSLIGLLVYAFDGTAAGVVQVAEGGIPFEGGSGAAGHAGLGGNAAGG